MSDTDLELLARYTRQHAEDAFAELVRRHLSLVYSAARQVGSRQQFTLCGWGWAWRGPERA